MFVRLSQICPIHSPQLLSMKPPCEPPPSLQEEVAHGEDKDMEALVTYIEELEQALEEKDETLNHQRVEIDDLNKRVESLLNGPTSSPASSESAAYTKELEQIIELLESEREDLESESTSLRKSLQAVKEEMNSHSIQDAKIIETLRRDLMESEEKRSAANDSLTQLTSAVPLHIQNGSTPRDDETSLSAQSSLASLSLQGQAVSSPGLTPRSEREAEDVISHLENVAKLLREENDKMRERAKKERRRRKDDAEKNTKKLDEANLRTKAFESMLQESKDKIKSLEASLSTLRLEKEATIKRTQDVVSRAVRGSSRNRGRSPRRSPTSPSHEWAVNNNPYPEDNSTDEERPYVKSVHSAWNSSSTSSSAPPPSYPPPQRRKSKEKKWLDEKLQRMGIRKETERRRSSSGKILPKPVKDGDGDENNDGEEPTSRRGSFASVGSDGSNNRSHIASLENFWLSGTGKGMSKKGAKIGLGGPVPEVDFSDL